MSPLSSKSPVAVLVIAAVAICVAAVALQKGASWYGHPFPGVLITADGNVSSIGMPTWSGVEQGLRFPDRILSIDGVEIAPEHGEYAARAWDRVVSDAAAHDLASVHVRVATTAGERELDLRMGRLDAASWWLYAGTLIFVGSLYALGAIIALTSSPKGPLARTFAKFALSVAGFMLTLFDAHTTRAMVPIFHASFACLPFMLTALALRLPDDVPIIRRRRWPLLALDASGLTLAAVVVARDSAGMPVTGLQSICTLLLGSAMILFVAAIGLRYWRATGTRRETLRVMFRATATPSLLVGLAVLITSLSSRASTAGFLAMPALALAPIATGVAFVRHDLWGSRAILSRVLTRVVAGTIAGVVAVGLGAAFAAWLGIPFRGALVGASLGAVIAAPLVFFVARGVERRFFPAATQYKPTIEQLSEELTSITDPHEVALAVERTVRRWLPCERVRFLVADPENAPPSSSQPNLQDSDELSIPASFGGRTLGWLSVGRKRGGALFTSDDVDLLGTIVNQAGLALAHAHSYAELERRRQQQAAAWQTERLALVETVAAEIAHEVRYPINFFRSVFRRDAANATLDAEEVDIGCEEVDRLERLVSGLRRMVGHRIDRRVVSVADLTARAEMLLRDTLSGRSLEIIVPRDAALRCDTDQVTQVLVNLVANAIDASGARGRVGVTWRSDADGAELVVWDDGPGFESDPSQLFSAWFTTKPRGTGLGLAITQRIVRAHGWGIDAMRVEGRTRFVVTIPVSDVIGDEPRAPLNSETISLVPRGSEHEDSHRR
ncbi:MAG TPA: HAMP domain-containing sensor histidine kinase [Polyangiaceae bacterium]|nr:HAMP domain-containing sensor histidine kinase [Polyangiaceae bacterium]